MRSWVVLDNAVNRADPRVCPICENIPTVARRKRAYYVRCECCKMRGAEMPHRDLAVYYWNLLNAHSEQKELEWRRWE